MDQPDSATSPNQAAPAEPVSRLRSGWSAVRELGPLGVLLAAIVVLPCAGVALLATTTATWVPWFATRGAEAAFAASGAVSLFLVATTLLCGLSVLPTYAVSLAAGYLYGSWAGSAVSILGVTLAAGFGRLVMTALAGDRLMRYVASKPRLLAVHDALLGEAARGVTTVVTLVRLAPVTPFAGTNLVMAAARVAPRPYVVGTLLGLAPRVVLFTVAGAGLAEIEFGRQADAVSIGVALTSLVLAVGGLWLVASRRLSDVLGDR